MNMTAKIANLAEKRYIKIKYSQAAQCGLKSKYALESIYFDGL